MKNVELHYEASVAKKVAALFRRDGRKATLRPARKHYSPHKRRVVVEIKPSESYYELKNTLKRKANALINLASLTKEQREENTKKAAETRAYNKAKERGDELSRGFFFEVLRDFVLKPGHTRTKKIFSTPRKKGAWVSRNSAEISTDEGGRTTYCLSVSVSRNIALKLVDRYCNRDGFRIESHEDYEGGFIEISFKLTEWEYCDTTPFDVYTENAKTLASGVYKPST